MDSDSLQLLIICGSITTGYCAKVWYRHRERRMEIEAMSRAGSERLTTGDIGALRQEIAGLRDTSTKFDISLEQTLVEMQRRLAALESAQSRAAVFAATAPASYALPKPAETHAEEPAVQRVGFSDTAQGP